MTNPTRYTNDNPNVRKMLTITVLAALLIFISIILSTCAIKKSPDSKTRIINSVESLYSYQYNYSKGTATLNIIPVDIVKDVYDNYEELQKTQNPLIPISLREYAAINTVYFDYATDCSIVWDKDTDDIRIEKTVISDREEYKEKQHKSVSSCSIKHHFAYISRSCTFLSSLSYFP